MNAYLSIFVLNSCKKETATLIILLYNRLKFYQC